MKFETLLKIESTIIEVASSDGVYTDINLSPIAIGGGPVNLESWDIKLTYKGYCIVERFNSGQSVEESDVKKVAFYLIKDLFTSYFYKKLEV